jgi:hypothetical protein
MIVVVDGFVRFVGFGYRFDGVTGVGVGKLLGHGFRMFVMAVGRAMIGCVSLGERMNIVAHKKSFPCSVGVLYA